MDNFAGSEPREFIPFHLSKGPNGQPRQTMSEGNQTEDLHIKPSPDAAEQTTSPGVSENLLSTAPESRSASPPLLPSAIEIVESTPSQSSTEADCSERANSATAVKEASASHVSQSPDYSPSMINLLASDNSSSVESLQTYFGRKVSSMEATGTESPVGLNLPVPPKESVSEPITITPVRPGTTAEGHEVPTPAGETTASAPASLEDEAGPESERRASKRPRIGSATTSLHPPITEFRTILSSSQKEPSVQSSDEMEQEVTPAHVVLSSSEFAADTDHDSTTNPTGSTIGQALSARAKTHVPGSDDADSAFFPVGLPSTSRGSSLGPSSRALIKEFFDNSERFDFPKGHPTVAFTEDQISSVLKVVADETVRVSLDAIEKLIQKASQLRIGPEETLEETPSRSGRRCSRRAGSATSGLQSDTSGGIRSDDDFSSIGYSYEHLDAPSINALPCTSSEIPCGSRDLPSNMDVPEADSPEAQTLAALKAEALGDLSKRPRSKRGKFVPATRGAGTRRKITRSCKIMKEAYFQGMEWTRTFVSGPMDPRWNPYKFYCQICKANISIYGKGAREILRHHSTEKHLRKDQRWRYEYLYSVDPVTRVKVHQVRGKDGKLLTPYQLEFELPLFINAPLVEIGQKLPFYDEYMAGTDYMSSSSSNRARVQLSVLAKILPSSGDIEVLKSFWSDVGVIVNHQSLFTDFNWGKERLSVSFKFLIEESLNVGVMILGSQILINSGVFCFSCYSITCSSNSCLTLLPMSISTVSTLWNLPSTGSSSSSSSDSGGSMNYVESSSNGLAVFRA